MSEWNGEYAEWSDWQSWVEYVDQKRSPRSTPDRAPVASSAPTNPTLPFLRDALNELYSYIFMQFNERWVREMINGTKSSKSQPAVLQFPRLFKQFQRDFETQLEVDCVGLEKVITWRLVRDTMSESASRIE